MVDFLCFLSPLSGTVRGACVCSFIGLLISLVRGRPFFPRDCSFLSYAGNLLNCWKPGLLSKTLWLARLGWEKVWPFRRKQIFNCRENTLTSMKEKFPLPFSRWGHNLIASWDFLLLDDRTILLSPTLLCTSMIVGTVTVPRTLNRACLFMGKISTA